MGEEQQHTHKGMASRFLAPSGQLARALFARNGLSSIRYYGGGGELTEAAIAERVINVTKQFEKVDASLVTKDSHFTKELGLDSLDAVELIMALEDEFALEVPEAEQENLVSVDAVINYVLSNPNAK